MKKVALLIIILACFSTFRLDSAFAQNGLQEWCLDEGQIWDPATSTCIVYGSTSVNSTLTILEDESIDNNGGIDNSYGIIINNGTIDNDGVIENSYGLITSNGVIANRYDGIINNGITIQNNGHIDNDGRIDNHEYITNNGTINNTGLIVNWWGNNTINNSGSITNSGNISNINDSIIYNSGDITNNGVIANSGIIYNICEGIYNGNPPDGNPIVYLDYCAYLPLIIRE